MRSLRSLLYVPANRPKFIEKAPRSGADAIGLVLEDSVPRSERDNARTMAREAIVELARTGTPVYVKVNALEPDGLESDIDAIALDGLTGIVVPKVRTVEDVRQVDDLVGKAEVKAGMSIGSIGILLLIETPLAVIRAYDLAVSSERVQSLVCGAAIGGDLAGALGTVWSPEGTERLFVMSKVLVDARAAGLNNPMDGVWARVGDPEGLVREAMFARRLGYAGKLAIHPEQIAPINRVFTPSESEVAFQRRVLAGFEEALARGTAATVVEGAFIDYAMVANAKRILELADAVGVRPDGDAPA